MPPRLQGSCRLVRYADDFVITCARRRSGERALAVLGRRLGCYGLTLHATKTRHVDFRPTRRRGHDPRRSFDFLGFTHVWGRSRLGRIVYEWCKHRRHLPVARQQEHLTRVIRGHCAYYGVTGNGKRVSNSRYQVIQAWRKW